MKAMIAIAAIALGLAACDSSEGGGASSTTSTASTAAPAAPAKSAAEIAREEREAEIAAERARLAGMTAPFDTAEEWVAGCTGAGIDQSICDCTVEKTVERIGTEGLYTWVWEGYVNADGRARLRSNKFFSDNGISKDDQQAFADDIGTCYTY